MGFVLYFFIGTDENRRKEIMKSKKLLSEFVLFFCVTFAVSLVVSFLYSLLVRGIAVVDWELSFRNGILFGLIFPLVDWFRGKKK